MTDLFGDFEDMPDPADSSARVAALDAVAAWLADTHDEDSVAEYATVLGLWMRDHPGDMVSLPMALLELAGNLADALRTAIGDEAWTAMLATERTRLAAEDVLTSAAYAEWVDEGDQ